MDYSKYFWCKHELFSDMFLIHQFGPFYKYCTFSYTNPLLLQIHFWFPTFMDDNCLRIFFSYLPLIFFPFLPFHFLAFFSPSIITQLLISFQLIFIFFLLQPVPYLVEVSFFLHLILFIFQFPKPSLLFIFVIWLLQL